MPKLNKKTQNKLNAIQPLEILALIASLFYLQSFNTNLSNYALLFDAAQHPDVYSLVFALGVTGYYLYKRKSFSIISVITLSVIATVSIVWFFGFSLNF